MTVQKLFVKNIYDGNGSNKIFPFTFECPENHPEYIHVYVKLDDVSTETDNFSVDMEGHNITYPVTGEALAEGMSLVIARELPLHQVLNLVNQGPFFAEDIEVTFDEMVMMIQQLNEKLERTSSLDISSDGGAFDTTLPVKAGYTWRVNDEGTGFVPATNPDTVAADIKAALADTETKVETELAGTKTYIDNSLNETTTSINTDLEKTKTDVATSLNATETKINTALDETMEEIDKKEKAIQELIDSLGGLTIEALVAVRNECLQKAAEAQGAADTALEAAEGLQSTVQQVQTNTYDISTLNTNVGNLETNKANVADVYTKTDTDTSLSAKLDKQQGVENAGKNLIVGDDGNVILGDGGGHVIVPAKPSPAEAKDKVVYFTIENGKAKGYIKNGDTMVEIGGGDGVPIGTILFWFGDTNPAGWIDVPIGTPISKTTYPGLFEVYGYKYGGEGDLFYLPNPYDKWIKADTVAGQELEAGLPNVEGGFKLAYGGATNHRETIIAGAFSKWGDTPIQGTTTGDNPGSATSNTGVYFSAQNSNHIYGNSDTVQPPSLTARPIIKAFSATSTDTTLVEISKLASDVIRLEGKLAEQDAVIDYGSSSDGTIWYRKHKSGWLEQGGTKIGINSNTTPIEFIKNMADTNYNVQLCFNYNGGQYTLSVTSKNVNSITTYSQSSGVGRNIIWYVCGMGVNE